MSIAIEGDETEIQLVLIVPIGVAFHIEVAGIDSEVNRMDSDGSFRSPLGGEGFHLLWQAARYSGSPDNPCGHRETES